MAGERYLDRSIENSIIYEGQAVKEKATQLATMIADFIKTQEDALYTSAENSPYGCDEVSLPESGHKHGEIVARENGHAHMVLDAGRTRGSNGKKLSTMVEVIVEPGSFSHTTTVFGSGTNGGIDNPPPNSEAAFRAIVTQVLLL